MFYGILYNIEPWEQMIEFQISILIIAIWGLFYLEINWD